MLSLTKKSRVETLQHRSTEGFRIPGDGEVKTLNIRRSPEVPKCEIPKTQNRRITRSNGYRDFGYREMEKSETLNIRSPEVPKSETPKFQKQAHHIGISVTGRWRSHRLSS
jgi:hypothetical protein